MSGQAVEAHPVLRVSVEAAWYALHIAKDPAPPTRALIWRRRGRSAQATQDCKNEFRVDNVRQTHKGLDRATADAMDRMYQETIEFGGHPNQVGVGSSAVIDEESDSDLGWLKVAVLNPGTLAALHALKTAVEVAVGVCRTVSLIYPERFRISGLDREIGRLLRRAQEVFPRHAEALRPKRRCP
jgi:hypothetical protein